MKSDIGQADTGTTQDFDYPELTLGSYGYLPNDRRHTLKLFGNYEMTDEWSVGAQPAGAVGPSDQLLRLPRPGDRRRAVRQLVLLCNASLVCRAAPAPCRCRAAAGPHAVDSHGRPQRRLAPPFANGNLQFKVDVFNVFNADKTVSVNEFGEDAGGNPDPTNYLSPTGYQRPRSVRFMVQYSF